MIDMTLIGGPVIGSVIGYFTNYIAVKMLFRPLYPVKIGKYTLPFTPGIIPKGKERISKTLGSAIGDTLVTKEDIAQTLLSDDVKSVVSESILQNLRKTGESDSTLEQLLTTYVEREDYDTVRKSLQTYFTDKIMEKIEGADIGSLVAEQGAKAVQEKVHGSMLAFLLNESTIQSFAQPLGEALNKYIAEYGPDRIHTIVTTEIESLEQRTLASLLEGKIQREEQIRAIIEKIYTNIVISKSDMVLDKIDIAGIVENKLNTMDVLEVEELVLSVMKKELNAIVNLGALIGFVIGLLNLLL